MLLCSNIPCFSELFAKFVLLQYTRMNKLTDIVKRYGLLGCLRKTIYKILGLFGISYTKYFGYFKTLPETKGVTTLPQYHKMSMDDFKLQAKYDGKWFTARKLNQIEKFINEPGYSYYGIYDGDKLICYCGISLEYDNFINRETNPQAAYLFDDYTNPNYRGMGMQRKMIELREHEAKACNKSATYAYVQSTNRASEKNYKRCGYVAQIELIYKRTSKNKPYNLKIKKRQITGNESASSNLGA